jgi:hypothetical protein
LALVSEDEPKRLIAKRLPARSSGLAISGRTISLSGMKFKPPATTATSEPRRLALTARDEVENRNCASLASSACMPTVPFSMAIYSRSTPYFFKSFCS